MRLAALGLFTWAASGCGASAEKSGPTPAESVTLGEIGAMFFGFKKQHKMPQSQADIARFANGFPNACAAIAKGDLLVRWGAGIEDTPEASRTVLVYEKKVPQDGGAVLMQDGSINSMTPDEFKSAPKAGK